MIEVASLCSGGGGASCSRLPKPPMCERTHVMMPYTSLRPILLLRLKGVIGWVMVTSTTARLAIADNIKGSCRL